MSAPLVPENLTLNIANKSIKVSWDISVGATRYEIQRSLNDIDWTTLSSTETTNSYWDIDNDGANDLIPYTLYYYKVQAHNDDGGSGYTTSKNITYFDISSVYAFAHAKTLTDTVPVIYGKTNGTDVKLFWKDNPIYIGYKIYKSYDNINFTEIQTI